MIDWYTSVLGMRNGPRPNFPFPVHGSTGQVITRTCT
jgi:hypothetical protein